MLSVFYLLGWIDIMIEFSLRKGYEAVFSGIKNCAGKNRKFKVLRKGYAAEKPLVFLTGTEVDTFQPKGKDHATVIES